MPDPASDDARVAAEIERLKAQFPKTRDLYREVCALLFFRFGVTPTANRLYQLVHRGSMSTPTTVLAEFWAELREKSRVRIEHPDLPAELRQAAGELVGTLWSRATAAADAALDGLRADIEAEKRDAQQSVATLQADLARTETALEQRTSALLGAQVRIHELEQSLAAAEGVRSALDGKLAPLRQQAREHEAARASFASERDRLRAAIELADARLQEAEKRAALEIERERAATVRLQRDADAATQALAGARAQIQALQQQLGDLRHRNGTLEGQLEAMRERNARRPDAGSPTADVPKSKVAATDSKRTKDAKQRAARPSAVAVRAPRKVKGGGAGPRSGS